MANLQATLERRADRTEQLLEEMQVSEYRKLTELGKLGYFKTGGFLQPEDLEWKDFAPCEVGFSWERNRKKGGADRLKALEKGADLSSGKELPPELSIGDSVWFKLDFSVPQGMSGKPVYLKFSAKPVESPKRGVREGLPDMEALCFKDGQAWQAFDQGRDELLLLEEAQGGEHFQLLIEVGTTMLWGGLDVEEFSLQACGVFTLREKLRELYLNFKLFNDLRKDLGEDSPSYDKILRGLNQARKVFPFQAEDEGELARGAREALEELEPLKEIRSDLSDYKLTTAGHAHIDTAWLWPWSETVRKCGRTFSTALKLLDEYPSFRFLQSQPHLYEFARERYPELFSRMEEAIEEGRWEPIGALWVESDVNVTSGEALARQYLMGKRYFREQFGVDPKITFIPDVFGYSPALPGISQAADCPYFFTQKMCWSEINDFPHHAFVWQGINGSELLAHFLPTDTYNGMVEVEEVRRAVNSFEQKAELEDVPYLIGWGDGGGGVTREMLDKAEVMDEMDALPELEFGSLRDFFRRLEEEKVDLPRWVGELYLERHRGTLTTQARTKRNNRKAEFRLRETELWSTMASLREGLEYPREKLEKAWKITLFNQFHDVLPGSSIREVYQDAERDYGQVFEILGEELERALSVIGEEEGSGGVQLRNSLSWNRDDLVELNDPGEGVNSLRDEDGTLYPLQKSGLAEDEALVEVKNLPPLGVKSFEFNSASTEPRSFLSVDEKGMENSKLKLEFDEEGYLRSLYDKEAGREIILEETRANDLRLYRDIPLREGSEAWDIDEDYCEVWESLPAAELEVLEEGPLRATLRQRRSFGDSQLIQDVILYRDRKRIDFETSVDWHEDNKLLKAHFPLNLRTDEATFETQFGHFKRPTHDNTSWDAARFEVSQQKWLDLSEYDYGVGLLNDCKYGVSVDGTDVGLSLLRATPSPDPEADRGEHRFVYSLLPHEGTLQEGNVVQEAYQLNVPVEAEPTDGGFFSDSLMKIDTPGVIVEAVKPTEEDEERILFRVYEAYGRKVSAILRPGFSFSEALSVNLVEDVQSELQGNGEELELEFDPFEIKSIVFVPNEE